MIASSLELRVPGVLHRHAERAPAVPVVFDSPHSGRERPPDFDSELPESTLRQSEDAYVEELFGEAPGMGAVLLEALFPRCYVDVNRTPDDLDPALLATPWPEPLHPSGKTMRGTGLIWRRIPPDREIYDRPLTVAEVQARIDRYWQPYHAALQEALDERHGRFGAVWHVNCHSMPSWGDATTEDGPVPRAQFVLGDRDGTTCEPAFTAFVAERLRTFGYEVKLNDPYKGVELVRRHGRPGESRHSLQVEINRALYLNEATLEKTADFAQVKRDIGRLMQDICSFVQSATAKGTGAAP